MRGAGNRSATRAVRLVPMTDLDAGRMWRGPRAAPLLTGYRGAPAVDTAALEDLLLRLGRLAEDLPEVAELDLNPVLAGPDGVVAVDAKLRLAPVGAEPDPPAAPPERGGAARKRATMSGRTIVVGYDRSTAVEPAAGGRSARRSAPARRSSSSTCTAPRI